MIIKKRRDGERRGKPLICFWWSYVVFVFSKYQLRMFPSASLIPLFYQYFFYQKVSYHIVSYRIVLYHIVSYPAKSNFGIYYGQHYFIWEYVLVYIMVDIIPLKIILFVVVVVDVILLWIWALRGSAILVCSLPMKSRKGLARDVFGAFATHASLAYDVTDTLLGSNWSLFAKWFDLTLYLLIIIYFYCKDKNNK